MSDDGEPARTALVRESQHARSLASRGVVLIASNALIAPLIAVGMRMIPGRFLLVVVLGMLVYAVGSTLTGLVFLGRGWQLDRRATNELRRLDHGDLPPARLLR